MPQEQGTIRAWSDVMRSCRGDMVPFKESVARMSAFVRAEVHARQHRSLWQRFTGWFFRRSSLDNFMEGL